MKGKLAGLKMAYIGDGNVAHSLMMAAAKTGMKMMVASPEGYEPDQQVFKLAEETAGVTGAEIIITNDPKEAAADADVIYTDVWTSMGQEEENEIRLKAFAGFQVNEELVRLAKKDFMFLHCLPAHRGEEVAAEVIDGKNSYVFQQAGNRLHAKALLLKF